MPAMPAVRGLNASAAVPRGAAIEIDAISRPARTFTGDFYFTHRRGDSVWLALGDVAGKGLPAAIVMAMIQEELERRLVHCAETNGEPAWTLTKLHEFLLPLMPTNRFATAVIARLDDDGVLTLANGGHCPPLLVRADGSVEQLASTGPILGLLPHGRWHSVQTHLGPDDRLVLYSDGVTEATRDEEELGVRGLVEIVRRAASAREILGALAAYERADDTTLVVVRRA